MKLTIIPVGRKNTHNSRTRSCRGLSLLAVIAVLMLASGCGSAEPAAPTTGRTISHAMGSTVVPVAPQRVVVLDTQELDAALSLGVVPVGATRSTVDEELPSFLADRAPAGAIELVGTIPEPDLETIARLQPDLILSSKFRHEALYGKLSGIAPTVFAERTGDAWKQNFLLYADALGRKADAQRLLADYQSRAAALGDRIGAPNIVVSVVRFMPQEIRLYTPASFIGSDDVWMLAIGPTGANLVLDDIERHLG